MTQGGEPSMAVRYQLMKFGGLGTIICEDTCIQNLDILLDVTYISEKVTLTLGMGRALMGVMNMWRVFNMHTKYEVNT